MDETANLKLPYILAAQSQKHVTHNEALRALDAIVQLAVKDKDLSTPPGSPADGDRYIVGAAPTASWSGHATHVAAWQDGTWAFYVPVAGWLAWVDDESESYLFAGGGWIPAPGGGGASLVPKGAWSPVATYATGDLVEHEGYAFLSNVDDNVDNEPDADTPGSTSDWTYFSVVTGGGGGSGEGDGSVNPVSLVGVNATADTTNRLSVSSPASLFNHEGAGHQLKINKDAAADTASVLFQTDFSGRAEFGLAGDDDFHVKVSPDGSAWHEAIVISRSSGAVRATGLREVLSANRTYYVRADGSDSNNGFANTSGGAFLTLQKAWDTALTLDLAGFAITIQAAAGTYAPVNMASPPVGGLVSFIGDTTTPSNVVVSGTALGTAGCFNLIAPTTVTVRGFKVQTTTSGWGVLAGRGGTMIYGDMDFGACASGHARADSFGLLQNASVGPCTISGAAPTHWWAAPLGVLSMVGFTLTISGTPNFSTAFAQARGGVVNVSGVTFSGSATGTRYGVDFGGLINTFGGGASYLPGNAAGTGGTTTGGGFYA